MVTLEAKAALSGVAALGQGQGQGWGEGAQLGGEERTGWAISDLLREVPRTAVWKKHSGT